MPQLTRPKQVRRCNSKRSMTSNKTRCTSGTTNSNTNGNTKGTATVKRYSKSKRQTKKSPRHPLWKDISPKSHEDRVEMVQRCGTGSDKRCFLLPRELKYPICPQNSCQPTEQGIRGARRRAILQRNEAVRAESERRLNKWLRSMNVQPISNRNARTKHRSSNK